MNEPAKTTGQTNEQAASSAQAPALVPGPALAPPRNPFERSQADHLNAGAVAIESERAVAEAQGKLVIAKRFPRDQFAAFERVLNACKREGLAGSAFYSFPRAGQTVSGPSIRLAEELARCWGNITYGIRELSNRDGVSEMEAYAWDMETNTMSSQVFTVRHLRDTKGGGRELTDQRDIYEIGANMGARRLRARILAILPDDLVEAAVQTCKRTLATGGGESLPDRIKRTVAAFSGRGVSVAMLEEYLGHPLDMTTPDELADLHGVFTSLKDGQAKVGDYFGAARVPTAPPVAPPAAPASTPAPAQDGVPAPAARRGRTPKPAQPEQAAPPAAPAQEAPAPATAPATAANDNAPAPAQEPEQAQGKTPPDAPGQNTEPAAPLAQPGDLF